MPNRFWVSVSLVVLGAAYVWVPIPPLRLAAIAVAAAVIIHNVSSRQLATAGVFAAGSAWALAFIATPTSSYINWGASPQASTINGILALLGMGWLTLLWHSHHRLHLRRWLPSSQAAAVFALIIGLLYIPSWYADLPYSGDENFHMARAAAFWGMSTFVIRSPYVLLVAMWGITAAFVVRQQRTLRPQHNIAVLAIMLAPIGIALLTSPKVFPSTVMEAPLMPEIVARYPTLQPWLTAFLNVACAENWHDIELVELAQSRLLPMLCLVTMMMLLLADRRWRTTMTGSRVLAATVMAWSPLLRYHGSILYLDLAVTALTYILIADGHAWTQLPVMRLERRASWWAAIALGFMKETAMPILMIVMGVRWLCRWSATSSIDRRQMLSAARAEVRLLVCLFLPAVTYFVLRMHLNLHPYHGAFSNALTPSAWAQAFTYTAKHFGVLTAMVPVGIVVLCRRGAWRHALLCVTLIVGMRGFFMCEGVEWLAMARYSLCEAPALIYLSWEAMTWLMTLNRRLGIIILLALLAGSIATTPMTAAGKRKQWGNSGEVWNPYRDCFEDLKHHGAPEPILIGNLDRLDYDINFTTRLLNWTPTIRQVKRIDTLSDIDNLHATLQFAASHNFPTVVYRNLSLQLPEHYAAAGFIKVEFYPSPFGGLTVFVNAEGAP